MPPEYPVPGINCDRSLALPRLLHTSKPEVTIQQNDLVRWILGSEKKIVDGIDGAILTRPLLIVAGSPGSGKTWLMCDLWQELTTRDGLACYWVDCGTDINDSLNMAPLIARYDDELSQLEGSLMEGARAVRIAEQFRINHGNPSVLLVDAYDDLNEEKRDFLEQWFLSPYLEQDGQQPARLVIALRDPEGVKAPALRLETASLTLVPLYASQNGQTPAITDEQGAIEQIRRRCRRLAEANDIRRNAVDPDGQDAIAAYQANIQHILEPPEAPEENDLVRIYGHSPDGLEQIQNGLRDKLTGNPHINNLLLWYALRANDGQLSPDDRNAIWTHYLRRARLVNDVGEPSILIPLLEEIHTKLEPEWTETEFAAEFGYKKLNEVEPMYKHGILITAEDGAAYRIHPDMVAMLQLRLLA